MEYVINQRAYDAVNRMHQHFWQTYGARPLGNCRTCKHCDKTYPSHWMCEQWGAGNGMCYDGNYCVDYMVRWEGGEMSKTRICDKCGKVVAKGDSSKFSAYTPKVTVPGEFHLCPECAEHFAEWLDYRGIYTSRKKRAQERNGI